MRPNGCHLSRDERQAARHAGRRFDHPSLRYFIGDVRDAARLDRAFVAVTIVVHRGAEAGSRLRVQPIRGHSDQHHGRP